MCYWGVAFALGPNINAPITEEAAKEAWQAIEQARALPPTRREKERAYIEALAKRYAADPKAERAPLDRAYADAMRDAGEAVSRRSRRGDALRAVADGHRRRGTTGTRTAARAQFTNDVLAALESVLARKPDHIGAIHLYIHAVEASPNPGRAEQYADRLAALVPGAGHLVHMPAHIYLRTGRYNDASVANENAIKADEAYFAGDRRRRQHDVSGRLLPAQHPLLRDVRRRWRGGGPTR